MTLKIFTANINNKDADKVAPKGKVSMKFLDALRKHNGKITKKPIGKHTFITLLFEQMKDALNFRAEMQGICTPVINSKPYEI